MLTTVAATLPASVLTKAPVIVPALPESCDRISSLNAAFLKADAALKDVEDSDDVLYDVLAELVRVRYEAFEDLWFEPVCTLADIQAKVRAAVVVWEESEVERDELEVLYHDILALT